ncbi:MAG: helix-hairpin-helix domain-containing protein [Bacteroidetes bacterium]|nr:helix-hairpin-helix domain-containing protein [Bacteroidota bacterium]
MRRWWNSYTNLPYQERWGIVALLCICVALISIYLALPWVLKEKPFEIDQPLQQAFQGYVNSHPVNDGQPYTKNIFDDSSFKSKVTLFTFDPNTLDSEGFLRLGLRHKTVRMLLNWRRKGKHFYQKEDLKQLYTLEEEVYKRLEPYIIIPSSNRFERSFSNFPKEAPLPEHIELNTTDSATIVRLNGIGPTLAHKIIERRKALGGYLKIEQLNEIFRFSDTTLAMLKTRFTINPLAIKRLKLNTATFNDLKAHPYIGEKMAQHIILYREGLGRYSEIEQLRQVPLMNEEIYRKIAPYFVLE